MKNNILIKHLQMNKVGDLTALFISFIIHVSTYSYELKYHKNHCSGFLSQEALDLEISYTIL